MNNSSHCKSKNARSVCCVPVTKFKMDTSHYVLYKFDTGFNYQTLFMNIVSVILIINIK